MRFPTSALATTYVVPLAPEIVEQLAPSELQRSHSNAKLIGVVPDQDPVFATRVSPLTADPVMVGGAVFAGATCVLADPLRGARSASALAAKSAAQPARNPGRAGRR
jgi:hypothetical protein